MYKSNGQFARWARPRPHADYDLGARYILDVGHLFTHGNNLDNTRRIGAIMRVLGDKLQQLAK